MTEFSNVNEHDYLKEIPVNCKICALSGAIAGLFAHGFMLTNKLPNHDDLLYGFEGLDTKINGATSMGRWFQQTVGAISGEWSLPWLNGLLFIFFLVLAACTICSLLKIKNPVCAVFLGTIVCTFPCATSTLLYMPLADTFAFALLLACLSAFFTIRYKAGCIVGGLCLTLSLGIYQAYLPITIALFLLVIMRDLLEEKKITIVLHDLIKYVCTGIAAVLLYLCICKITYPAGGRFSGSVGVNLNKLFIRFLEEPRKRSPPHETGRDPAQDIRG